MSFQEIKSEPQGKDVAEAYEHLNERADDISNIIFDYEDVDKIPIKEEEIKQEIKPEPLDKDNKDVETHVIDVEKDQEKSELQAMVDKLLKEKQTLQKDMIKFVDLQVEHQMLKSDKYTVERQLEELQVENQTLKYENQQFENKVQDLQVENQNLQVENQNMKEQIHLHCAQLLSNTINSNKNKTLKKVKKSKNPEEEPDFFQAEEFNFPDPIVSSNHSNSSINQITLEHLTIPDRDNLSSEFYKEKLKKVKRHPHSTDSYTDDEYYEKSKDNEELTTNVKRIPRKTRKEIRYDEDKSDDISSDSGSDKEYSADKDETQDETENDDISDMEDFKKNKETILKKKNVAPKYKENQVNRKEDLRSQIKTVNGKQRDSLCKICGKSFFGKFNLNTHVKIVHEKQKDYKCKICGKSFGINSHLKQHIKTVHEKQRDYKCKFCGKSFGENSNLSRHIKTVHQKQKNYKCDYCSKKFSRKVHKEIHERRIHNIM